LQLLVTPYTLLLLAMLEMVRVALPVLVSVTVWTALVVPTAWLANVSVVGFRETAGVAVAVTVTVALAVGPVPLTLAPATV
jgi:hypothetical protein